MCNRLNQNPAVGRARPAVAPCHALVRRRSPDRAVVTDRKVSWAGRGRETPQLRGRALCAVWRPAHNGGEHHGVLMILAAVSLLVGIAMGAEPALQENLDAQEFAAALRGRWESVFALPGRTNISRAEFRADDTATVLVTAGDVTRTNTGPYRLEFERPPVAGMVTLAKITVRTAAGDCVLHRVNFGLHNKFRDDHWLLRIDGNPHGTLDRVPATGPVSLVAALTNPSASWEMRCRAEDDLTNGVPREVLAALLPYTKHPKPEGMIWNSAGRESDRGAPVEWQIFYAVRRAWDAQAKRLTATEHREFWLTLLPHAHTAPAKTAVLDELTDHWNPDAEPELLKLLVDAHEEFSVRRAAGFCLSLHAAKSCHAQLVELLADAGPFQQRDQWLDILANPRHRDAAGGVDARVVRLGFALLAEERQRSPDYVHGAYFIAIKLGNYVGAKNQFQPDTSKRDESFFAGTVQNAQRWWALNRRQFADAPAGNL